MFITIEVPPNGITISVRLLQSLNASKPIEVIPTGRVMLPLAVAPSIKILLTMTKGFFTCWLSSHFVPLKALCSNEVTLEGMVILVSLLHPSQDQVTQGDIKIPWNQLPEQCFRFWAQSSNVKKNQIRKIDSHYIYLLIKKILFPFVSLTSYDLFTYIILTEKLILLLPKIRSENIKYIEHINHTISPILVWIWYIGIPFCASD